MHELRTLLRMSSMLDILPTGGNCRVPPELDWRSDVYKIQQMRWLSHLCPDMSLRLYPDGDGRRSLVVMLSYDNGRSHV